jgi:hypothetical protein
MLIDEEINRWAARRRTAQVLEIIQGRGLQKGMENALKANLQDVQEQ